MSVNFNTPVKLGFIIKEMKVWYTLNLCQGKEDDSDYMASSLLSSTISTQILLYIKCKALEGRRKNKNLEMLNMHCLHNFQKQEKKTDPIILIHICLLFQA